jgi:fucose 4-O-acetylase-like acetyltransferase
MASSRLKWIDIAKGIAILLMVLGHSSIPSFLSNLIWAFHMPLFFIASGWTTNWQKTDFIGFTKRKIRTLLVPFIFYSFIILSIYILEGWVDFNHWIYNGWVSYALWFIPVLFLASLFSKLIYAIKKQIYFIWVCLCASRYQWYFEFLQDTVAMDFIICSVCNIFYCSGN